MRYARLLYEDSPCWAWAEDDVMLLLDRSPLRGGHQVLGSVPTSEARFLPPVVPSVFFAVGMNYRRHIEHARAMGNAAAIIPERPEVGYRANNALLGHGETILIPRDVTGRFEAEGEVVAVIGRELKHATRGEVQESVFGWTIGNDLSAREWQHSDRTLWRAKNSDTFKPMGPWIETEVDPMAQTTTVIVNGHRQHEFSTGDMVFDPWDYLVEISKYITLCSGDVLWMGSGSNVHIEAGEIVEVSITGIGTLANPVETDGPPTNQGDHL